MDTPGWNNYNSQGLLANEVKSTLLGILIPFCITELFYYGRVDWTLQTSPFLEIMTDDEKPKMFAAVEAFANAWLELAPKPQLTGNLPKICRRLCVDDFDEALKLISELDFSTI
ncbi:hypothetical protein KAZ57_00485 [Patescibacteria group bacterium]|nr:hypothetical protein [Patescibacteria group bacterium]